MKNNAQEKLDIFTIITNQVIEALEANIIPWKKPWTSYGMPKNYLTKKNYRGLNALLLNMSPYEVPYFLTFKQTQQMGGFVKKGSKGLPVIFFSFNYFKKDTSGKVIKITQEEATTRFKNNEEILKKSILRYYTVFNISQIEGVEFNIPEIVGSNNSTIENCENIISKYTDIPSICSLNNNAYYNPIKDYINMPQLTRFHNSEGYYATLFHELIHSTGHENRLSREELTSDKAHFGSKLYSIEELTAEMGSAFLCGLTNILPATIDNTKSYITGWLEALKKDKNFIFSSASKGQQAVDYITGLKFQEEGEE